MKEERQKKKHALPQRCLAAIGCLLIVIGTFTTLVVGLTTVTSAILIAAVATLLGPVAVSGSGGVLDFLSATLELALEGCTLLLEAIASIFSGLV